MSRRSFTDADWAQIEPLVPGRKGIVVEAAWTTGCLSMPASGWLGEQRRGAIFLPNWGTGSRSIPGSGAGRGPGFGTGFSRR